MNEHNKKRKFLFDESRYQYYNFNKHREEEFNFLSYANEIFRQGFAALIWRLPRSSIAGRPDDFYRDCGEKKNQTKHNQFLRTVIQRGYK